ncbi:MAG TPA: PilN domain-containing protein [Candidatus Acidoferrales bacterium]|jgi:type IV pilus assembly protein PilN|nr:PilN domain-containing protein [Candidatus Acidoferrales bacterium]
MIRINLLGQSRPKATKQTVPLEATMQIIFLAVALGLAAIVLSVTYFQQKRELDATNARISALRAEKQSLQQVKQDVERFESQKAVLEQRINVIETLQKNRTGGQELLETVANTVVRVDALWLTSIERKGDSLDITGEAGSINAVANFITQLRRSGYFDKIEIKEAKEDDVVKSVQTYNFTMTAAISQTSNPEAQPQAKPAAATPAPQPAAKGRS